VVGSYPCDKISLVQESSASGEDRMKKVLAGLTVAVAVVFVSLGLAVPAQAYPDTPPSQHTTTPASSQAAATTSSSSLPNTGGPDVALLGGGLVLVVAGGAVVLSARSRQRTAA
jgi:LPXTG-motif cell wall-anchored protein